MGPRGRGGVNFPKGTMKVYLGAPHGMCVTHAEQVTGDLFAFLKA
jgi:non-heme chloroperoxidase